MPRRNLGIVSLVAMSCAALLSCQEGAPSEGSIPLPSEQTPRICAGQIRSVTGSYPATAALATLSFQQTRSPDAATANYNVQATVVPYMASDAVLRDSRDTTQVLLTFTRPVSPSPSFPFAGGGVAINGNVDADTFFDVLASGAAEIVFLTPPSTKTQGPIKLTPTALTNWTTKTC